MGGDDDSEEEYWKDQGGLPGENTDDELDTDEVTQRREALLTIVRRNTAIKHIN